MSGQTELLWIAPGSHYSTTFVRKGKDERKEKEESDPTVDEGMGENRGIRASSLGTYKQDF